MPIPPRSTTPVRGADSRYNLRMPPIEPELPPPSLRRELGVASATLLVVGGIIGSGIFFTPAEVARALPNGTMVLLAWAIGGVVALAGALTYAELGAMMPDAGGAYIYIREAFGPVAAFLYGWMLLAIIATGALAAVALGFAGYLARFVDISVVGGPIGVATITIVALAGLNYLGIRPGAFLQNVLTVAKTLVLAAIIVGGFILWKSLGAPLPHPGAPAPRSNIIAAFAAGFVPVLFTIGGWQQMNMVAGEIRRPDRTIPRALTLGILIVIAVYLGANAAYLRALGRDGLASSTAVAADTATRLVGPAGGTFVAVAAMLSILGFVNVVILATPRVFYAMARDRVFLDAVSKVHPRFGTPYLAILLMAAWSVLLLFATRGDVGKLLDGVVFADWIFFGLGAASVFVLRRTRPDADRPYLALGYPVVPAFFVVAAAVGVLSSFIAHVTTSLAGTALLLVGVGVYMWFRRRAAFD